MAVKFIGRIKPEYRGMFGWKAMVNDGLDPSRLRRALGTIIPEDIHREIYVSEQGQYYIGSVMSEEYAEHLKQNLGKAEDATLDAAIANMKHMIELHLKQNETITKLIRLFEDEKLRREHYAEATKAEEV